MANIIFPYFDNQEVSRKGELFLLWAALHGVRVNIAFHIATQLDELAKNTKVVIAASAIACGWVH